METTTTTRTRRSTRKKQTKASENQETDKNDGAKKKKAAAVTSGRKRKKKDPPTPQSAAVRAEEKRLAGYRSSCPVGLEDRVHRAMTQRLYLIRRQEVVIGAADEVVDDGDTTTQGKGGLEPEEVLSCQYDLLGSTGNVYTVTLAHRPTCTCPDYCRRSDLCKHIFFVLLKVIGLDIDNPLSFQKAYVTEELRELFTLQRARRVGGTVQANARVVANYAKMQAGEKVDDKDDAEEEDEGAVKRRALEEDDRDCPICFDAMEDVKDTTYCRAQCGANFHKDCIRRWCQQQPKGRATCPNCRQPWQEEAAGGEKGTNREGYVNLGALQGLSPVRDTSTYKRYRRWY